MRTETRRWSSRSSPGGVRNVVRADEGRCNRATFPRVSCGRGREAGEPPTSWFTGWTTSANGLGSESDRDHGRNHHHPHRHRDPDGEQVPREDDKPKGRPEAVVEEAEAEQ